MSKDTQPAAKQPAAKKPATRRRRAKAPEPTVASQRYDVEPHRGNPTNSLPAAHEHAPRASAVAEVAPKPKRLPRGTTIVDIPAHEKVTINASDGEPKWISAAGGDLHGAHPAGALALYANAEPVLITATVIVREPNGHASSIYVATRQPAGARVHERN